jgi:molybdopterin synthase sulfur carrier subunit
MGAILITFTGVRSALTDLVAVPIHVKYFASMRERMGRADDDLDAGGLKTVADVWARVAGDQSLPRTVRVAVNQEYADLEQRVKDGDEIAFFPPVTGG